MSFEQGTTFLEDYAADRYQALMSGKRVMWSTSYIKTYSELIELFDRTDEDINWNKAVTSNKSASGPRVPYTHINKLRNRLTFLAGTARDIRTQFCCGTTKRQKTIMDTVRYELIRLNFIANGIIGRLAHILRVD
jgi:hypothetical protein